MDAAVLIFFEIPTAPARLPIPPSTVETNALDAIDLPMFISMLRNVIHAKRPDTIASTEPRKKAKEMTR